MPAIQMTRRFLSAYADTESWKWDHDEARSCLDLEEKLAWGVRLFNVLLDLEGHTQARASGKSSPETEQLLELMPALYQLWALASEHYLKQAVQFQEKGYEVEGFDDFRATVEEARCLLGNLGMEDHVRPIEDLILHARPEDPRPGRYGD